MPHECTACCCNQDSSNLCWVDVVPKCGGGSEGAPCPLFEHTLLPSLLLQS